MWFANCGSTLRWKINHGPVRRWGLGRNTAIQELCNWCSFRCLSEVSSPFPCLFSDWWMKAIPLMRRCRGWGPRGQNSCSLFGALVVDIGCCLKDTNSLICGFLKLWMHGIKDSFILQQKVFWNPGSFFTVFISNELFKDSSPPHMRKFQLFCSKLNSYFNIFKISQEVHKPWVRMWHVPRTISFRIQHNLINSIQLGHFRGVIDILTFHINFMWLLNAAVPTDNNLCCYAPAKVTREDWKLLSLFYRRVKWWFRNSLLCHLWYIDMLGER